MSNRIQNEIKEKAELLVQRFESSQNKPSQDSQWKKQCKTNAMQLLWECHFYDITPPVELVMLIGHLFGSRHAWPTVKYAVASHLAMSYPPVSDFKNFKEDAISSAARVIDKHGGVLKQARELDEATGNDKRDYRRTIKSWIQDPLFTLVWAAAHKKYKVRKDNPSFEGAILSAKKAIQKN